MIRMVRKHISCLGLLLLLFFLSTPAEALAQEKKTYASPKFGFALEYPAAYELKVGSDCYLDFKKGSETLIHLRVDDHFIEWLYQMLRPGLVVFRAGKDPYRELAQETRKDKKLFQRYARHEAQNWCTADGPDSSVYCREIKRERLFTSRSGLDGVEFYPLMTSENFADKTKQQTVVGPVLAVYLPQKDLPVLLVLSPLYGRLAPPGLIQEMRGIIDSIKMTPEARKSGGN